MKKKKDSIFKKIWAWIKFQDNHKLVLLGIMFIISAIMGIKTGGKALHGLIPIWGIGIYLYWEKPVKKDKKK